MATTTQLSSAAKNNQLVTRPALRRNPLVRWHLLSLDAASVAALWTWFLARVNQAHLPTASLFAMATAVWMLYAADRLLDTRNLLLNQELEERHYFHRANQRAFSVGIILAAFVLAMLLPGLPATSLHLYLILGSMLFAYFVLIHLAPVSANAHRLPKELAVGVFFSAATFIPTVSRHPELRLALLPAAILFAVLCSLNCLFIYAWEHPIASPLAHPATQSALRFLPAITITAVTVGLVLSFADTQLHWQIPAACALSTSLLLVLHRIRRRFTPTTLRAAADLCLLAPLLLLPVLPQ